MHRQEANHENEGPGFAPSQQRARGSHRYPERHTARRERQTGRMLRRTAGRLRADEGAATAEYAVATMAAVGFAGLLIIILRGDEVRAILTDLVRNALTVG